MVDTRPIVELNGPGGRRCVLASEFGRYVAMGFYPAEGKVPENRKPSADMLKGLEKDIAANKAEQEKRNEGEVKTNEAHAKTFTEKPVTAKDLEPEKE